jgi:hypothetical protein
MTEENKERLKSSGTDQGTIPDVVTSVLCTISLKAAVFPGHQLTGRSEEEDLSADHQFEICTSAGIHQGTTN